LIYLYSSSEDEDEEEEEEELELDDSEESDVAGRNRRGGSGRHRRNAEPVRRSTRARITRFDKEFSKLLLMSHSNSEGNASLFGLVIIWMGPLYALVYLELTPGS